MLTGLFLTLIVAALLLHFFLVERPRRKRSLVDPSLPEPLPLEEALGALPEGALFQPTTFTWVRILPDRHILLGLHPLLVSLVGSPYRLDVIPEGWHLAKGKPLLRIKQGRRLLQIFSPVTGRIAEVNPNACMEKGWTTPRDGEECWVYRVEPENLLWEVPSWLEREEAKAWIRNRCLDLRGFLAGSEAPGVGNDSGDLPVGVLAGLDKDAWNRFQDRFLTPEESVQRGRTRR